MRHLQIYWQNVTNSGLTAKGLKPHVRDKRLYGTLTSGLCWSPWLIPHNVLLNAQTAGSEDKRTWPWVQPRSSVFHRPIQYGHPNYIGEYTREPGFEPYMQQGCCIQRLFDILANHHTHNTRPHCHFDWRMGIGCAMAAERWVWSNEKPYFSYVEISALRIDTGNSHTNKKFHFGMINKRPRQAPVL